MIPYGRQDIGQADIDAVVEVLRSDFLTQGPAVPIFEQAVAKYCGAQHALAVNSATSALHIACLALDLGPGDLLAFACEVRNGRAIEKKLNKRIFLNKWKK